VNLSGLGSEVRWQGIHRGDLVLPALFGAFGTVEMVVQGYRPLPVALGTYWLAASVLCARRLFPLAMPLLVAAIYALTPVLGFDVSEPSSWILLPAVAFYAAGSLVPRSRAPVGLASVIGALVIVFATLDWLTTFDPDIVFGVVWVIGPWMIGVAVRETLERNRELAIEAERARGEAERAAASAAAAERERIARELHDVLAHSLSVMVVQASLAEDLVARDAEAEAAAAMRQVQQIGRDALGETGRLLRLIRDDEDELGMQPQHTVADLSALAEDYARAGLDVDLVVDPAARTLPLGVGLSAYRIVQEALTNALKHAPGSRVTVRLERRADELSVEVENGSATGRPAVPVESGHGLVGVRERVALFGGTLRAGPTDGGGFRLAATLPTPPETG
jgi:signal transduction histidine kinase